MTHPNRAAIDRCLRRMSRCLVALALVIAIDVPATVLVFMDAIPVDAWHWIVRLGLIPALVFTFATLLLRRKVRNLTWEIEPPRANRPWTRPPW